MHTYPVHYSVARPGSFSRLQLLIRGIAFLLLGVAGISFGGVFVFVYLGLPVWAAIRLGSHDSGNFVAEDGPRIVRLLHGFAVVSAWFAFVIDRVPLSGPSEVLDFHVSPNAAGRPTPRSAILRVFTGIPSALLLMLLGAVGLIVWLWAAASILLYRRVGEAPFDYLVGLQRWCLRLLVYQASLVADYPPLSLTDTFTHAPGASAH